jgi:3',5'-cyclic AMP phosphodiesterase CpdA
MDIITRRRAVGMLAAPFALPLVTACREAFAPSSLRRPLFNATGDGAVSLIGAGDPHAAPWKTGRVVYRIGGMIQRALDADPNAHAFALGDLVPSGTVEEYEAGYAPAWGGFLDRTFCQLGNHDLIADKTATPYYDYVGERGGPRGKGFYAVNLGDHWRSYWLNSQQWHDEQTAWLRADLASHPDRHKLAAWHTPMFASVCQHTGRAMARPRLFGPWWEALQEHGAELVLCGHVHRYERFARMLRDGTSSDRGVRQFIVGTGGAGTMPILTVHPHSEVQVITRGIARFDLYPDRYEWTFVDVNGAVRDAGVEAARTALTA